MSTNQSVINRFAIRGFNRAREEMICTISEKKFRSCQATVIETENYYLLRSYDTIVAAVWKVNGQCYDVLRAVYGYTSTSSQHIRKFFSDYSRNCVKAPYVYKPI